MTPENSPETMKTLGNRHIFTGNRQRRAPKSIGRCCWICGKTGGMGATVLLALLGYEIDRLPNGDLNIAYAHPDCIVRERKRLAKKEAK